MIKYYFGPSIFNKISNPYLICVLTILAIVLHIVGDTHRIFALANFDLVLIMLLISDIAQVRIFLFIFAVCLLLSLLNYYQLFPALTPTFVVVNSILKVAYFLWGWITVLSTLTKKQKVTGETISLAVTGYLFIGVICSFVYFSFWEISKDSFHLSYPRDFELKSWNLSMYFSLITLTTVGYGDIIPSSRWLMVFASFEAITGLIYIAVIVARLVSLYDSFD